MNCKWCRFTSTWIIYVNENHLFIYLHFFLLWNVCYKSIYVLQSNNEQTNKNEKKNYSSPVFVEYPHPIQKNLFYLLHEQLQCHEQWILLLSLVKLYVSLNLYYDYFDYYLLLPCFVALESLELMFEHKTHWKFVEILNIFIFLVYLLLVYQYMKHMVDLNRNICLLVVKLVENLNMMLAHHLVMTFVFHLQLSYSLVVIDSSMLCVVLLGHQIHVVIALNPFSLVSISKNIKQFNSKQMNIDNNFFSFLLWPTMFERTGCNFFLYETDESKWLFICYLSYTFY